MITRTIGGITLLLLAAPVSLIANGGYCVSDEFRQAFLEGQGIIDD